MSLFRSTSGQGTGRVSTGESATRETYSDRSETGVDPRPDTRGRHGLGRGPLTLLSCSETLHVLSIFCDIIVERNKIISVCLFR